MVFEIEDAVFERAATDPEPDASYHSALRRLMECHRFSHRMIPRDVSGTGYQAWLTGHADRDRARMDHIIAASFLSLAGETAPLFRVSADPTSTWERCRLSLLDAAALAEKPLTILVENRDSDRAFLLAVAPPMWRQRMREMEESGALYFDSRGGVAEIIKRVKALFGRPLRDRAWWLERLRTAIVVDRDVTGGVPTTPSPKRAELLARVAEHEEPWSMPAIVLSRRAIENFLPDVGISELCPDQTHRLVALRRLADGNPQIRWYIHMKEGISKDAATPRQTGEDGKWIPSAKEEREVWRRQDTRVPEDLLPALFRGLDDAVVRLLRDGLGSGIAKAFEQTDQIPGWEMAFEEEYARGPEEQLSRVAFTQRLMERA
jgi:hypothetical protein